MPPQSQKGGENARTKYSVYDVVHIRCFGFHWRVVKIPKYRKTLGDNMRMHRRSLKWSQEKLAEKADLHPVYVGKVERGEENVSLDALARIASALKVQVNDLTRGI